MADTTLTESRPSPATPEVGSLLRRARSAFRRIVTTALGAAAIAYAAWKALDAYVLPVSGHAVVAGRVRVLRAPIDGTLEWQNLRLGAVLPAGTRAGFLRNPWTSDLFVRDVGNKLEIVQAEIAAIEPQTARLEEFAEGLRRGAGLFQLRRVDQLQSLQVETEARLESDRARAALAQAEDARAEALLKSGLASEARRAETTRDRAVAEQAVVATEQSLHAVKTRLEAARQGMSVDSNGVGSESPYAKQRLDEVTLELMRLRQRLEEQHKVEETLTRQREQALERFKQLSEAALDVGPRARVWKLLSSDGEYVRQAQALVALLECDGPLVVATVREGVFNQLRIGGAGRFEADDGAVYEGRIIQLDGLTRAREDDAIVAPGLVGQRDPIPATADPYRVTLSFASLGNAQRDACTVGRSGRVVFQPTK